MKPWIREFAIGLVLWITGAAIGQTQAGPHIAFVKVPGSPFAAVPSVDGQWLFVSMTSSGQTGLAVLHREEGGWVVFRVLPFKPGAVGLALTHDGRTLVAAAHGFVIGFDVQKLIAGFPHPNIGEFFCKSASAVYVAITADDNYAFVSNESFGNISVLDLARARRERFSDADLIGTIPVGTAPVGLAFSPDGRLLYSTSEIAPAEYGWSKSSTAPGAHPDGMLAVIDVGLAEREPSRSIVWKAPSGDRPVRVVVSPDGARAYVTVRGSDCVNVFSTAEPLSLIASVPVGHAPVGLVLSNDGRLLFVLNSDRFGHGSGSVSVIDTGKGTAIGSIPTQTFPREACLTADGRTLIVTNFDSDTVEFIDVSGFLEARESH